MGTGEGVKVLKEGGAGDGGARRADDRAGRNSNAVEAGGKSVLPIRAPARPTSGAGGHAAPHRVLLRSKAPGENS